MFKNKSVHELSNLIARQISGQLSHEEKEKLDAWLKTSVQNRKLYHRIRNKNNNRERNLLFESIDVKTDWLKMEARITPTSKNKIGKLVLKYAAAILIPLTIGFATYLYVNKVEKTEQLVQTKIVQPESVPMLIMANGENIHLGKDSIDNLVENDGTLINVSSSEIVYKLNSKTKKTKEIKNKLVVPKGGDYRLTLSDGTKVFVNSMSTLEFPVQFLGDKRVVNLEGEAYFEVSKDKTKPFFVNIKGMQVEVLGTSFNVKAYPDEEHSYTTLVEGSVMINSDKLKDAFYLKPNQQAIFNPTSKNVIIQKVDAIQYAQWIHGKYVFVNQPLDEIMKTLSRWYDFNYEFKDETLKDLRFEGGLNKYESIYPILDIIKKTNKVEVTVVGKEVVFSKL